MNKYELISIVDASLPQEQKDAIYTEVADCVTKAGGKVINSKVWLEKQKFAFRIKRVTDGTYHTINFEGPGSVVVKLRQLLGINERILRSDIAVVED